MSLDLDHIHARLVFRRSVRARTWRMISDLLDSGMELNRALPLVADINGSGNRKLQDILGRLRAALRTDSFARSVARYVPESEAMLFSRFGSASDASIFRAAARLSSVDEKIAKAIRQALMWPAFLFLLVFVLLYSLGSNLFPTMATLAPVSDWPPASRLVAATAIWIANNVHIVAASVLAAGAAWKWVERNHTGPGRAWLDRIPPFSLYRLRTGATFTFVLIENARVGHEINRAFLLNLANSLPPYSRSRILAIAEWSDRTNIGSAAIAAGHEFPDPELNLVLRAYAGQRDWVPRFSQYANTWLDRLEEKVETMVKLLRIGLLIVAAGIIGSSAFVMVNMTSLIQ
ncbi:MAG: hypothetical protein OXF88_07755 [Rhodobacteraceae bacterium]|nr:hypothetical protein [Paracoccaceae bacterium]